MIGQCKLHSRVESLVKVNKFPHFAIFIGQRGSGRKTFINEHFTGIYLDDNKVDSIRKMIQLVYKVSNKLFVMTDVDNMSNSAKNALLKVVEECPNNNSFIMTAEDENNILDTIRSRATLFYMDTYTPQNIADYFYDKYHANHGKDDEHIVRALCETPGDVDIIVKMGIKEFYDYVQLVVDNIAEVSLANAFKISKKIDLKSGEGYDLKLFWKAFMKICFDAKKLNGVIVTSKYLRQLGIRGINKQMAFDNWVLEIRETWT